MFWKKCEKRNKIKFWTCVLTWNKYKLENEIFFWYCLNTTECKFTNFNIGKVNTVQNKFVCTNLAAQNGQVN